eukprot:CAMPEP_0172591312 /NCGR_PEP_ID=MMETSP1068-20121228/10027_1 /TAXON_ID=35684 /ORGANISM="Pseudopedinella elastica, Strain CCMP716" /LENGTH=34 /DNA_ID= /DNA_START= /DNA_END= /DNA_ORIENTATION=
MATLPPKQKVVPIPAAKKAALELRVKGSASMIAI